MTHFDVVVIGSGSAGFSAAEAARGKGVSVCLIEKDRLGGECPNWACIPTKALLKSAHVFRTVKRAAEFGINIGSAQADFGKVMAYKDRVVSAITGGGEVGTRYETLIKELGLEYRRGSASFEDAETIIVHGHDGGEERIRAKAFVIATGTVEFIPPIPGLMESGFWTFKDAVSMTQAPRSIAIIGAGPVGCEFATFFSTFGTKTTLIQSAPTVLGREDKEIAEMAGEALKMLDVDLLLGANVVSVTTNGDQKMVTADVGGMRQVVTAEAILLATGKKANVDGLTLGSAGVIVDPRGNIQTDAHQRTSQGHIFAAGDVDGGYQFTHTAHVEGSIAGANAAQIALGKTRGLEKVDERVVPRVTFLEPEVASVGMTSDEVKQKFGGALVGRFPIAALGRSVTESSNYGRIKLVAHPETGFLLGAQMIGPHAGEVIHELALAIHLNATLDDLGSLIHAFPTYSEAVAAASGTIERE